MSNKRGDVSNGTDTQKRLQAILRGAFAGPPTELADIPKRNGGRRAQRTIKPSSSSSHASAKNVSRRKKDRA
jgi:hypothetical protein